MPRCYYYPGSGDAPPPQAAPLILPWGSQGIGWDCGWLVGLSRRIYGRAFCKVMGCGGVSLGWENAGGVSLGAGNMEGCNSTFAGRWLVNRMALVILLRDSHVILFSHLLELTPESIPPSIQDHEIKRMSPTSNPHFSQTQTHLPKVLRFSFVQKPSSGNSSLPTLTLEFVWIVFLRSFDLSGPQFWSFRPCFLILYPKIKNTKAGTCPHVREPNFITRVTFCKRYEAAWSRGGLTPMYEAMKRRVSKGCSRNGPIPLNNTRSVHATSP
jgi:hypothetical protein